MKLMPYTLYIASGTPNGGIYQYHVTEDGVLLGRSVRALASPFYLEITGDRMNVIYRPNGVGKRESAVTSLPILPDGSLGEAGASVSSMGVSGCYIHEMDGAVYAANYSTGSLMKKSADGSCKLYRLPGSSVDPGRQEAAHTHQIITTPTAVTMEDGSVKNVPPMLLATDLGLDALVLLDADLNEIARTYVPAGHGCRHTVFSPDGRYAYTVNELISGVTVSRFDGSRLETLETVCSLPDGYTDISYGSAIRVTADGKHLYCSNRGHDSIAHFAVDGADVRLLETTDCGGSWPRDFNLSPDDCFLVCTNERGNRVTVYRRESDGSLTRLPQTIPMPTPVCAVFMSK